MGLKHHRIPRLFPKSMTTTYNVAAVGCCHGQIDTIYHTINKRYKNVDLVLINGDFQAMRTEQDLNCMACPPKYRAMGEFKEYYYGRKKAPILTVIVGGNHEASSYFYELRYGGWLAPNIYYIGNAGVLSIDEKLRLAGISGIYDPHHYNMEHFEKPPYDNSTMRSAYHIRKCDVQRLMLLKNTPIDVMMSHDWPCGITKYGNEAQLLRFKPFFKTDIQKGKLGSKPAMEMLQQLKPANWFSAHLHCRFTAEVHHVSAEANPEEIDIDFEDHPVNLEMNKSVENPDEIDIQLTGHEHTVVTENQNPEEIDVGDDQVDGSSLEASKSGHNEGKPQPEVSKKDFDYNDFGVCESVDELPACTRFLALDKPLPGRKFLELVQISTKNSNKRLHDDEIKKSPSLYYDPLWLAITRASELSQSTAPPSKEEVLKHLKWVKENIVDKAKLAVPLNFQAGLAELNQSSSDFSRLRNQQPPLQANQQTIEFLKLIGVETPP